MSASALATAPSFCFWLLGSRLPAVAGQALGRRCLLRRSSSFAKQTPRRQVDPYAILGLRRGARVNEVQCHGTVRGTTQDTEGGSADEFKRVTDAYEHLTNPIEVLFGRATARGERSRSSQSSQAKPPRQNIRMVTPKRADELFKRAFGGRNVDEVLKDEMARAGAAQGVHGYAIREALFSRLLKQARDFGSDDLQTSRQTTESSPPPPPQPSSSSSSCAAPPSPGFADAVGVDFTKNDQRAASDGGVAFGQEVDAGRDGRGPDGNSHPSTVVSREHFTDAAGIRYVRVTTTAYAPDGRLAGRHVKDKRVYRM
eukprot:TRINITY_DN10678_c0_g1_i1.p1 TRINITY_DN10678_c0_g1~~TRINITY_DN10678_c0_g1_i1.p1  ORF type:complete len:313 (-),score=47.29 TRINITY_DN10678_c0_g1_i1:156-1094(-)